MLSTGTVLVLDIALLSGFLFFHAIQKKKIFNPFASLKKIPGNASDILKKSKPGEHSSVGKISSMIEKKVIDVERLEKSLIDKDRKLDILIKKAEERLKNIDLTHKALSNDEVYSIAHKMAKQGVPQHEISRTLGLSNGEVELITAINNYDL